MGHLRRGRGGGLQRGRRHREGAHHERARGAPGARAPGRSGALPAGRGQDDALDLHPGAPQGAHAGGGPDRDAGEPYARHRPRGGRRLRQQAQHLPGGGARRLRLARAGPSDQMDREPLRELHDHHSRARPGGRGGDGAEKGRLHHRVPLRGSRRLRRLLPAAHRGHLHADGPHAARPLQDQEHRDERHRRVHQQDSHGRLPGRGPARGHLHPRADDGRGGARAGHGPGGNPPQEFSRQVRVPLRHLRRPHLRQRGLSRRAGSRPRGRRLPRHARAAGGGAKRGPLSRNRAFHLRRDLRHGPLRRPGRPGLGERARARGSPRARPPSSRAPRPTARASRPPSPKSWPTGWASTPGT